MRRLAALGALAVGLAAACIDFDRKLGDCAAGVGVCARDGGETDGGDVDGGVVDGGGLDGGEPDAGPLGFCFDGWCWVHPRPFGDELRAIAGTSGGDLWVAGAAGIVAHWDGGSWADLRVPATLDQRYAVSGTIETLVLDDGGVVVAGMGLLPWRWGPDDGGTWTAEPYVRRGSSTDWRSFHQIRGSGGTLVGVGGRASGVLVAVRSAEGWTEQNLALLGEARAVNTESGDPLMAVELSDHGALYSLDGGRVPAAYDAGPDLEVVYAMWGQPDAGLWLAGRRAFLALFDGGTIYPEPRLSNEAHAGHWVPGLGKNVTVGAGGIINEGLAGAFGQALVDLMPQPSPDLNDVWFDPGGSLGLAVGTSATLLQRDVDGWRAHDVAYGRSRQLYNDLDAIAVTNGRVFVGGNDALKAWLVNNEVVPIGTVVDGEPFVVQGAFADDAGVITVEAKDGTPPLGRLCVPDLATRCKQLATSDFALRALWGTSRNDLVVVGEGGGVYSSDGGGLAAQIAPSDGGRTFTGVTGTGGRVLLSSSDGVVYELSGASVTPLHDAGHPLNGITALPTGEVFAAGDYTTLTAFSPAAGWVSVNNSVLTPDRGEKMQAVFAFSPDDVWAVGTGGFTWHFDGAAWAPVEIGTRVSLMAIAGRQTGSLRELWVSGRLGAVLYKRYRR